MQGNLEQSGILLNYTMQNNASFTKATIFHRQAQNAVARLEHLLADLFGSILCLSQGGGKCIDLKCEKMSQASTVKVNSNRVCFSTETDNASYGTAPAEKSLSCKTPRPQGQCSGGLKSCNSAVFLPEQCDRTSCLEVNYSS